MQIQQLEYALVLAKHLNFTQAAEELHITQPTLSQQIKRLEMDLEVDLFTRQTRFVALTPAGKEFIQYASQILADTERLKNAMAVFKKNVSGTLSLAVPANFNVLGLADVFSHFSELYPLIHIDFSIIHGISLLDRLRDSSIMMGFLATTDTSWLSDDFCVLPIRSDRMYVVLSNQNPLSAQKELSFQDIKEQNIIMPSSHSYLNTAFRALFTQANISPKVTYRVNSYSMVPPLLSRDSIAFVAPPYPDDLKLHPSLSIIPFKENVYRQIYLVSLKSKQNNPLVRAFWNEIEDAKKEQQI